VFELISEILLESKFGNEEFIREKSVIMEEIKSNNEDPSDYVYDLLFEVLFNEHPMGMPIAGTIESVSALNINAVQTHYQDLLNCPMVISVSGKFNLNELISFSQKKFGSGGFVSLNRTSPQGYLPKERFQTRNDISQVHLCFGMPAVPYLSDLRHTVLLLSTMLGGGMSSRLFQGLREEKGLVYDVHSFVDFYSDCGIIGFYLNTDKKNLFQIIKELKKIFGSIYNDGFSLEEIEIAKTYITGNLLLSLENSTNRMLRIGREVSYLNKTIPVEVIVNKIKMIEQNEINSFTKEYLDLKKYSVSAIGPVDEHLMQNIVNELRS
ncbi:MAG: pitrilysin family protein, partial [candidate division WOR-3 bacterium]